MYLFHTNYGTKILHCTDHTQSRKQKLVGTSSEGQNQVRHTLKSSHFFKLCEQGWNFVYQPKLQLAIMTTDITYIATLVGLACLQALECCTKPCGLQVHAHTQQRLDFLTAISVHSTASASISHYYPLAHLTDTIRGKA